MTDARGDAGRVGEAPINSEGRGTGIGGREGVVGWALVGPWVRWQMWATALVSHVR